VNWGDDNEVPAPDGVHYSLRLDRNSRGPRLEHPDWPARAGAQPGVGRKAPLPGTDQEVEPNPQRLFAALLAPLVGRYDLLEGVADAIDAAVFSLISGGFLLAVSKTGAMMPGPAGC